MTTHRVEGVSLQGIASAVPKQSQGSDAFYEAFGEDTVRKIIKRTGVEERRISQQLCTSDLCEAAAQELMQSLGWEPSSIDALFFVSQTPDTSMPATACILHYKLQLSPHCLALDINLGCSGYVYGLWFASQLMMGGGIQRALLLAGDTASRFVSPLDRATAPLFGDAGSATALASDPNAPSMFFQLGTDGSGAPHLKIPAGGYRRPSTEETRQRISREDGGIRSEEELWMNGAEVFAFTLQRIPTLIQSTLEEASCSIEDLDAVVSHQANRFLLKHLGRRMKLQPQQLPINLDRYGNTSVASIPLAMTTELADSLSSQTQKLALVGFGVGWSWGAAVLETSSLVMPPLLELDEPDSSDAGNEVGRFHES